jgi:hypothetical protein
MKLTFSKNNNKGRVLLRTSNALVFLMTKRLEIHEKSDSNWVKSFFWQVLNFSVFSHILLGLSQGPAILETSPDRKEFCRTRPAIRPFQEALIRAKRKKR